MITGENPNELLQFCFRSSSNRMVEYLSQRLHATGHQNLSSSENTNTLKWYYIGGPAIFVILVIILCLIVRKKRKYYLQIQQSL